MLLQVDMKGGWRIPSRLRLLGARAVSVPARPALVLSVVAAAIAQPSSPILPFLLIVSRQTVPLGVAALGQGLTIIGRTLLGEGPLWDVAEQKLYWIDVYGETIYRASADGRDVEQ